MRFGIGHGPRFHLNLFGARCHWPCIQQTTSSIGSHSTNSSLLDNDYTSSWTYIQYAQSLNETNNSDNTGSTLNDTELISLINAGSVSAAEEAAAAAAGVVSSECQDSNEIGAALPWVNNACDRHARRDVRTLFPESSLFGGSSGANSVLDGNDPANHLGAAASECQYVNFPLICDRRRSDYIPFYTVGRSSVNSSSSHGSIRQSLGELFEFDTQHDNEVESSDWATGGDHPYGIPSSLLGGVLLNLDNQFRLSANTEWQNWGEFLTSAQEPETPLDNARGNSGTYENTIGACSNRNSNLSGLDSISDSNETNNSLNNENTANDNQTVEDDNTDNVLPSLSISQRGFLHRQFTLPPPPSSNSSTRSSGSGSIDRPRQQEWYFYDPRLVPDQRTERVTLDTSFRGLHNRCHMSSIIQPPAYDDIIQNGNSTHGSASGPIPDLPPPYTETEPPPSYDQSFGHSLALPTFQIGSLPVNPLERRLAASLGMSPFVMSAPMPEPDLLTDVNIDELLEGAPDERIQANSDLPESSDIFVNNVIEEETMDQNTSDEEAMENDDTEVLSDGEAENSRLSIRRYPVGFCLGRRPPLRWSRGMAPNRWAPSENWANNT